MRKNRKAEIIAAESRVDRDYDLQTVIEAFTYHWYAEKQRQTWRNAKWMGVPSQQCPLDLWVVQEMLFELRPDNVIEVGVKRGGTTLFLANMLDIIGHGRVYGVDLGLKAVYPQTKDHDRITLIASDSIAPSLHDRLTDELGLGGKTIVFLDGDHDAQHVYQELKLFERYVGVGYYIVVGDTLINGHPVLHGWGDGPYEAVQRFCQETSAFEPDPKLEKFILTFSPSGFLRRKSS